MRDTQGRFKAGNQVAKGNRGNTSAASKFGNGNGYKYGYSPKVKGYKSEREGRYMARTDRGLFFVTEDVAVMDHNGLLFIRKDALLPLLRNKKGIVWMKKSDILKRYKNADKIITRTIL